MTSAVGVSMERRLQQVSGVPGSDLNQSQSEEKGWRKLGEATFSIALALEALGPDRHGLEVSGHVFLLAGPF